MHNTINETVGPIYEATHTALTTLEKRRTSGEGNGRSYEAIDHFAFRRHYPDLDTLSLAFAETATL
jgi:hypothetical protein